jgi:hypothetical protein
MIFNDPVSRRRFLQSTVGGVAAISVGGGRMLNAANAAGGNVVQASQPETLVATLYKSLSEEQKKKLCFGFDHPLRSAVNNNWHIVKHTIGDALNADQQAMVREIFRGMHSEEYAQKVFDQVEHDGGGPGTFNECSVALFGEPGQSSAADGKASKFEFVLTGRHCTRRCDGNSVAGAAFGGPIFYGHAAEGFNEPADHKGNAYWYQALRANEVFKSLDGKQRDLALRDDPRKEEGNKTVELSGKRSNLPGVPVADLSHDQKDLVRKVLADLLAPFRKPDADEALKLIEAGGFDDLHLAFYKNMDIGNDGVWDVWQIEGPFMRWYFRGSPHVHTWVHVREPTA